jgi:nucleotide-binding universal stress UspA family protein
VCFAVKAAQPDGAHVHVFHMLPIPPYPKYDRRNYTDDKYATRRRMTAFGAAYLDGTPHTYHIRGGVFPHEELLRCARNVAADMIILGSHTREQQGKWYAGSVVERVGRRAPCPVLVLNAPTALSPWRDLNLATRGEDVPVDRRLCVFANRPHDGGRRSVLSQGIRDQPGDLR